MRKRDIAGLVRDSNAWASWAERIWRTAKYLGVDGWIAGAFWAISALIFAAAIRMIHATPWYVIVIAALLFSTTLLHLWNKWRITWSLRGVKSFDIEKFAEDCCKFYSDFADFMVNRQEAKPIYERREGADDMYKRWQQTVNFSQKTDALMLQRFGPRAFAICHQLQSLGIPTPSLFAFSGGDHRGVSVYIGTVGELLKNGLLEEARKLDPKITWGTSIR